MGPYALVLDAATFKKKASRILDRGRVSLVADMPIRPTPGHKWSDDLVPLERLAERLGFVTPRLLEAVPVEVISDEDQVIGFWGEQEVCRRLAMLEDCALFRPFPDYETAEILLRRLRTGGTIGVQVKTCHLIEPNGRAKIYAHRSSFVAAPTTYVVVLAWIRSEHRFHETSLVIPSEDLPSIAAAAGQYYQFHFHPAGSHRPSRVDRYRIPLETLAGVLEGHLNLAP